MSEIRKKKEEWKMGTAETPENLIGKILKLFLATPLKHSARLCLAFQYRLWRRKPRLVERLSNFLPIDGTGSAVQVIVLTALVWAETNTFLATIVALEVGSVIAFVGNRFVIWQDRFTLLTRRQRFVWFMPLLLIFSASTLTLRMKLLGINSLEYFLGVHVLLSWSVLTVVGAVANYLGADLIAFGAIAKTINKIRGNPQERNRSVTAWP
jgi:putative flippase GtrA